MSLVVVGMNDTVLEVVRAATVPRRAVWLGH
jgi:hypothetical protein